MASSGCAGDISIDAKIYAAESSNGVDWTVLGAVSGAYASAGKEVYASDFVYKDGTYYLWITEAESLYGHRFSQGTSPTSLTQIGTISGLNFGWAQVRTFLNSDGTVLLIYSPRYGSHPGADSGNMYMADTTLSNPLVISNEQVVAENTNEYMGILKDSSVYRWYYWEGDVHGLMRTYPTGTLRGRASILRLHQ